MGNSYVSSLFHVVFSTKNHQPWLQAPVRGRLWPYIGGIASDAGMTALSVGGPLDHVHMLLSIPADIALSHAVQQVKGASSRWLHETFPELRTFAWQEGYGAFSIGISQIQETRQYIERQVEHHRKLSFREEYVAFLRKNHIPFDEQYV